MNLLHLMTMSSLVATLAIGGFVLFSQPRRQVNRCFALLTVIISAWLCCLWGASHVQTVQDAMFWIRQSSAVSALIPAGMNLLKLSILRPQQSCFRQILRNRIWLTAWLLVALLCQTEFFLQDATLPDPGNVLAKPHYGPGFLVFNIYFIGGWGILFYSMVRSVRQVSGVKRTELEFIVLSCVTSLLVGVCFLIIPNITGLIELGSFLPVSVIIFAAISAYGIATRGILDVPVVTRRILAHSMLTVYLLGLYITVQHIASYLLSGLTDDPTPLASLIATVTVVLSVSPAQGVLQRLANRLFINTPPLDVGATLREASRSLNTVVTTDTLLETFTQLVHSTLDTPGLQLHLETDSGLRPVVTHRFPEEPLPKELVTLLNHKHSLVVPELLERERGTPIERDVIEKLHHHGLGAAIGLYREEALIGALLLGPRESGRIFGHHESAAVEGLRDLFLVAYENARLYTEIRNRRTYMNHLLASMVNGVIATDRSKCITTCNHEAARILHLPKQDDLLGKEAFHLPLPLQDLIEEAFRTGQVIRDRNLALEMEGFPVVHVLAGASLFRGYEGELLGALLVLQDQTIYKQLESQVRRSERLASLGTLSAGMAHEIKNPLVTLKTFTQLLPERYEDQDFRTTFSQLAGDEIERIDRLVNQLLTFAKPAKPSTRLLSLHEELSSHLQWCEQQAQSDHLRIITHFDAEDDQIHGDPDQVKQVLLNIFLNARDVMPEGGEYHLRTEVHEDQVLLEICDTGPGIPEKKLQHIFDPFYTTKETGTGLGLAVAHQILREHRARIQVDNRPEGGSRFRLFFPLVRSEAET